jgi:hypothetical protein
MMRRIFHWTGGHPYLTQHLCLATATASVKARESNQTIIWDDQLIDQIVEKVFFSDEARRDPNLSFVRDRFRGTPAEERKELLALYRDVYNGIPVLDDDRSQTQLYLELFGLVRVEQGQLRLRNEIYRRVFNNEWIAENLKIANDEWMALKLKDAQATPTMPNSSVNWTLVIVAVVAIVVVAVVAIVILTRP